jgi:hypothetical protein
MLANRFTYTQVAVERHKGYYLATHPMVICDNTCVVFLTPQPGKLPISCSICPFKSEYGIVTHSLIHRNKREARSYSEISKSLGVDDPSQILFITDVFEEAVAAKSAGTAMLVPLYNTRIFVEKSCKCNVYILWSVNTFLACMPTLELRYYVLIAWLYNVSVLNSSLLPWDNTSISLFI